MKINFHPSKKNQGSALFITVMIAVAVAATVATYLLMVQGQYRSVIRSQTWNTSLVVAEAGVEEALAFVNKYQGTTNALAAWTNAASVSADGWANPSSQVYTMSRTLTNGSYAVIITNTLIGSNYSPVILSSGTATWRLDTASAAQPMFASSGVAASSPTRTLFVQTKADSNLTGGLISQTTMDFHGNNVTVDSYDSSKNTNSWFGPNGTNFTYNGSFYGIYTNTLRTADAVVGTDGSIVNVGNAEIYGYVNTGPGGTANINANGSVGDMGWIGSNPASPANNGIQPGHSKDDMNVTFSNTILPAPTSTYQSAWWGVRQLTGTATNSGVVVTYDYIITNKVGQPGTPTNKVYYSMPSLQHSGGIGASLFINASNVVLYLPGGATLQSSDMISLGTNSSVEIYVGNTSGTGDNFSTGNATVNNFTHYAPPFKIYGLQSCSSIDFSGNGSLTAWIYAPQASVNFNGGGNPSNSYDVCGAFMVHDIQVNGHYNFHFDVVLKTLLPPYRYVPFSWGEQ